MPTPTTHHARRIQRATIASALLAAAAALLSPASGAQATQQRSITQGPGETTHPGLLDCSHVRGSRISAVGRITSTDGKEWVTPAETNWQTGPRATDLYNACLGVEHADMSTVNLDEIPIAEIDPDGEIVTGYIFADNYFELYVNGQLAAVDSTPFTPFNASIVRFRAKRPMTLAFKLVDWEENLGLGTEAGGSARHHPGDGGLIASFDNGVVTDDTWRAQTYYIAPLSDPDIVVERGNVRDTSSLGRTYPQAASDADCALECYAVRYPIPENWTAPEFDDSNWPQANEFTEDEVGTRQRAYRNFRDQLTAGGATFIWSSNLVFDNLVLARKTID